jgi:hemolysin activation/secretion protein
MTKRLAGILAAAVFLAVGSLNHAAAQDAGFDINQFQVDGNTLLPAEKVQALVAPFSGKGKVYGDVQKALEALESEYRRLGYGTVQVFVPEQELTGGVVRLVVSEGVIGKVTITGNQNFNEQNVRAGLPDLKEGTAPNMRKLSENIQLSNENPAKQVEVTLGVSEEEGKVNARIDVKEEDPDRFYVTLDNTGTRGSGYARLGFSYQNSNMFNMDQVLTLSYTTAIDPPGRMKVFGNRVFPWDDGDGVEVDIYSIGYRVPLYALGDSIDVIYANSSTNTPANVLVPGGGLGINGKGEIWGLRYNHIFPRAGEYTSRLVLAYDRKYLDNTCDQLGVSSKTLIGVIGPCTQYTIQPVSATYSGQWQRPGESIDFYVTAAQNIATGADYPFPGGNFVPTDPQDNYSFVSGYKVRDDFSVVRAGGSYFTSIGGDWLFRFAANAQYSHSGLPVTERFGLAGWTTVRGFNERAIATDRGHVVNFEVYTPDTATSLGVPGTLKFLAFVDSAQGSNAHGVTLDILSMNKNKVGIASAGVGLRYNLKKDISARFDVARVLDGYSLSSSNQPDGDIRGHVGVAFGF